MTSHDTHNSSSNSTNPDLETQVQRVVEFFENLSPGRLGELAQLYHPQARFKDPFNDVRGVDAIRHIFDHMYASLHEPRFVVTERVVQADQCFLVWEFHFRFRNFRQHQPQLVRGASHLAFSEQGTVTLHRDYWDAAEEMYEKLPLVGALMRWLKRRANR
jgi:hypothetical protein